MEVLDELGYSSYRKITVDNWKGPVHRTLEDFVAEEVPVVMVYNQTPHVVMLCSPQDLEDFAIGFSLTENIVSRVEDIESIKVYQRSKGIEVRIKIPDPFCASLTGKGKNMTGRTGCGLCGATTLEQAIKPVYPVGQGLKLSSHKMEAGFHALWSEQKMSQATGAVHAAAWLSEDGSLHCVREDVGRHNALDKLIGSLSRSQTDFNQGWLLVTSRASYEMVQKAASVGICLLAAISAPTGLAIRLAEQAGMTLIGFARNENHVIYTHPHRLQH